MSEQPKKDYSQSNVHKLLINYFMAVRDRTYSAHKDKSTEKAADILLEVTGEYTDLIEQQFKTTQK